MVTGQGPQDRPKGDYRAKGKSDSGQVINRA